MTDSEIQTYLAAHPEKRHRKYIPQIVQELTGVEPEKQIAVKVAIRRLQEEIPNDEKGEALEREWRADRGMASGAEIAERVIAAHPVFQPILDNLAPIRSLFPVDQINYQGK